MLLFCNYHSVVRQIAVQFWYPLRSKKYRRHHKVGEDRDPGLHWYYRSAAQLPGTLLRSRQCAYQARCLQYITVSIRMGHEGGSSVPQRQNFFGKHVTLAYRKQDELLCVYTDASDLFRSRIVTQILQADVTPLHVYRRHEALSFLSGRFIKTQLGC